MLQRIEELNRAVWGNKVTLATTVHALGGLGVGLLVNRRSAEHAKPLAYALIAISLGAHLYALMTMSSAPWMTHERVRVSI